MQITRMGAVEAARRHQPGAAGILYAFGRQARDRAASTANLCNLRNLRNLRINLSATNFASPANPR